MKDVTMYHVGSAISHFEELAFAANGSRWDEYLAGHRDALNTHEKSGALVFFGKGLCASGHTPPLYSDFQFHSVGIIGAPVTMDGQVLEDVGRFAVTGVDGDMYSFRTPPLRNVTKSAPYSTTAHRLV